MISTDDTLLDSQLTFSRYQSEPLLCTESSPCASLLPGMLTKHSAVARHPHLWMAEV
jgi:hypothetical protein